MWWRKYVIVFLITSVVALLALMSCERPEPMVKEKKEIVIEQKGSTAAAVEEDNGETLQKNAAGSR